MVFSTIFYFLSTYGVCKKKSIVIAWVNKRNSRFDESSCFVCLKVIWKVDITSQFSWTNFRRNSTRKIVRWFEELINLHLTIFITEFHQKLMEKLSKKIQLSLSHSSLLGRYFTLPQSKLKHILSVSHLLRRESHWSYLSCTP